VYGGSAATKVTRFGRIFRHFGQYFDRYRSSPYVFLATFSWVKVVDYEMGWAKFWAIFQKLIWSPWLLATNCLPNASTR
jgi:hypothetical protein